MRRLRFFAHAPATIRVDWVAVANAPSHDINLGYSHQEQGVPVPDGCRAAVVHRTGGAADLPIACAFVR